MAAGGFVKIDPGLGAPARAYGRKHAGVSDADLGSARFGTLRHRRRNLTVEGSNVPRETRAQSPVEVDWRQEGRAA